MMARKRTVDILKADKSSEHSDHMKAADDAIKASRERLAKATKDTPAKKDAPATKSIPDFLSMTPTDETQLVIGVIISRLPGVKNTDGMIPLPRIDKEMETKTINAFTNLEATMFAVTAQAMVKNDPKLTLTESIAALKKVWKNIVPKAGITPAEIDIDGFNGNLKRASEELGKLDAKQRSLFLIELARTVDLEMAKAMEQDLNRLKEKKTGPGATPGGKKEPTGFWR